MRRRSLELPKRNNGHLVNEDIRGSKVRLIESNGDNVGVVSRRAALIRAQEQGLDLVQIGKSPDGEVIAKIMDFGRFMYDKKKQEAQKKKTQKVFQMKEVKFRPGIGDQDYMVKMKRAIDFLLDGKRVKFTLQFRRGRESALMATVGPKLFARIHADLEEKQLGSLLEEKEQRGKLLWSKIYYLKGK